MTATGRGCVVSSKAISSGRQYFELRFVLSLSLLFSLYLFFYLTVEFLILRFDDLTENCNRIGVVDKIPLNLSVQPNEGWLYCPACGKGYGYLGDSFQGPKCRQGLFLSDFFSSDSLIQHFHPSQIEFYVLFSHILTHNHTHPFSAPGDVFGIAIDMENRRLSFYKNNGNDSFLESKSEIFKDVCCSNGSVLLL